MRMRNHRPTRALFGAALGVLVAATFVTVPQASASSSATGTATAVAAGTSPAAIGQQSSTGHGALTAQQRAVLQGIAKDTWSFYAARRRPDHPPAAGQPRPGLDQGCLHLGGQHRRLPVGRRLGR